MFKKGIGKYIFIAIGLIITAYFFYVFRAIISYVLMAWVLSMIGRPLMHFFQHKIKIGKFRIGANLSAGLTLLSFLVFFGGLILFFTPTILEQAGNLAGVNYDQIAQTLEEPFQRWKPKLAKYGIKADQPLSVILQQSFSGFIEPTDIANIFKGAISTFGTILMGIFSILFITFFFLKEEGLFTKIVAAVTPGKYEKQVTHSIEDITTLLSRYFRGVLIQIFLITSFITIALNMLGVNNAFLIGLFAALINVIPYIGPLIGGIFATILTISSSLEMSFYTELLPLLSKVILVFMVMQILDGFVIQPYIFSNSVSAHPLEIFLVILLGAQINGITGMVLAIPTYTVIRVIAKEFLFRFRIVQKLTQGMEVEEDGGG